MKLKKEQLVLYTLGLFNEPSHSGKDANWELISSALGITSNTLDLYMTKLSKKGHIQRIKKKYARDIRSRFEITESGKEELENVREIIGHLQLTEDRHNIPACLTVKEILKRIKNPLEKVFFLTLYNQNKYFDLPSFLDMLKLSKEETGLINIFCDLDGTDCGTRKESFVEAFFRASLYGEVDTKMLTSDTWKREDIDALIVLAESRLRMGKLEDTKLIHNYLLSPEVELTQNQWFLVMMDWCLLMSREGKLDESIDHLDQVIKMVENKVYLSYAKMIKARCLFVKKCEKSVYMDLFNSSIKSFKTFGLPLFLSMAYNYRGVCNFVNRDFEDAEKDWVRARRYAKEADSAYAEAKILPNLADIAMKKGKFDLARNYLESARKTFEIMNDYEGLSIIEFNLALFHIESGNVDQAVKHFQLCNEIAFPLPSPQDRKIFREEVINRANENGIEGMKSLI